MPIVLLGGAGMLLASGEDARALFGSTTEVARAANTFNVVEVSVLFGSVQVVVPDDAQVDTGGLVVFGSVDCGEVCTGAGAGPRIEVIARGGFGSVEIVRQSDYQPEVDD